MLLLYIILYCIKLYYVTYICILFIIYELEITHETIFPHRALQPSALIPILNLPTIYNHQSSSKCRVGSCCRLRETTIEGETSRAGVSWGWNEGIRLLHPSYRGSKSPCRVRSIIDEWILVCLVSECLWVALRWHSYVCLIKSKSRSESEWVKWVS